MTPGRPISAQSLVARLWDGDPPPKARDRLHPHITRLRSRLQSIEQGKGAHLRHISGAYILETDADNIDYHRFRKLRAQARTSMENGRVDHALRLHREAADLWRGDPLAGLPGLWAAMTRKNLEDEMLSNVIERISLELDHGDPVHLIAELSELVTRFPFDEKLVELLMRSLYAGGRQADALAAYRQARGRLVDELAMEAGPALQELHQRILLRDPRLLPPARPRKAPGNVAPNDLPRDVPTFTGRTAELALLTSDRVLQETAVPVLAIDGMPGVGKTALAVHLAHRLAGRYPDGLLYLNLNAHSAVHEAVDPAAALDRLLRHLGLPADDIPEELDARAARWRKELAGRKVLIVLDDATGQQQIDCLLPGVPGCLVIVTSRRRLAGLDGAESLSLDVLSHEEATALLRRVVGAQRALEADHVAEVARLCGHLPLAIQLVAGRLRHRPAWSVADLAERLRREGRRLAEIRAENREITAAFRLSYDGLAGALRHAFVRLGLYPGTELTSHCAAALLETSPTEAENLLEELLDHHLIAEPRRGRYRFHDLIRDYTVSLAQLEPEAERKATVQRVLDYHLFLADRADRLLYPHRARIAVDVNPPPGASPDITTEARARHWLNTELDDLLRMTRHASGHGWTWHAAMFPHVLSRHLSFWGRWHEAVLSHTGAVEAWRCLDDQRGVALALTDLSEALWRNGRLDECLGVAAEGLRIQHDRDDQRGIADLLDQTGLAHWHRSEFDTASHYFERALAIRRTIGDRHGQAASLNHIAAIAYGRGDYREASHRLRKVLSLYEEDGDRRGRQVALNNLGELETRLGNHATALRHYEEAAALAPETGPKDRATLLHNISKALHHLGRHAEALERYTIALRLHREIGDARSEAHTLNSIGSCHASIGDDEQALLHHHEALRISAAVLEHAQQVRALLGIGDVHMRARRHETAGELFGRALHLARDIGDLHQEAHTLDRMGTVLHESGDAEAAVHWWRALALYERLGVPEAEDLRRRLPGPPDAVGS
ncbi:BTAD domain-containing putative transcriptional regulator [Sphaerisporangium sp. TRM90804]|uniref:AfsR/SARP family transcriptional regulator n=1 Tax=Sphaerisporangium sp. TRM90804 TaxID=3031113 RepID=UPI0024495254|nr:BTAD domain-containing putative transcriptional regulator [Sphaerisporangium sp. TRM90804]MDH2424988.1 BTAD domain-containing putative transcriptional regulator [Sphaerisporangium sp. TRM90804]